MFVKKIMGTHWYNAAEKTEESLLPDGRVPPCSFFEVRYKLKHLKVVLVEDSPFDVALIERELDKAGITFNSIIVSEKEAFENTLRSFRPDVILCDHNMPRFNSIEAFGAYKQFEQETGELIPFILITGEVSEEFAVQCIKAGVDDYILKDRLKRLPLSIEKALEKCYLENERSRILRQTLLKEKLMKEAEQLAHLGSWQADLITGEHIWSDENYRISGYEPGAVTPGFDVFFNIVHPDDTEALKEGYQRALKDLDEIEGEFRIVNKKGQLKYLSGTLRIDRDENGKPARLFGFILDITARKEAEMALVRDIEERKLAEEKLRKTLKEKIDILESIDDGFFTVDHQGTVNYWNNRAEIITGIPRSFIVGKDIQDVSCNVISHRFFSKNCNAINRSVPLHYEEYYSPLKYWFDVNVYPSESGISVYFKNITGRKNDSLEIERQHTKLKEIARIQSHQIRAPLARMMGLINIIQSGFEQTHELPAILDNILTNAKELDAAIRKTIRETE